MKWLATADLHLTDRPKDEYRFGLFQWLVKQQVKYKPDATFVLGDLTEFKDRHTAKLTNRVADELFRLQPPVYILRGNHDGVDPENPFFRFLSKIEGIHFIIKPTRIPDLKLTMIPHQRTQAEFDEACQIIKPGDLVMLHATFEGAEAESGRRLSGLSASPIESANPRGVWAGDVHKPQRCGSVTYLGAPFHIRFGDNYTPRALLVDGTTETDLHFDAPRKWSLTVTSPDDIERNESLRKGDQVKLTIQLTREEVVEWAAIRRACLIVCKERDLDVYGAKLEGLHGKRKRAVLKDESNAPQPKDVLKAYCEAEGVGVDIKNAGMELL